MEDLKRKIEKWHVKAVEVKSLLHGRIFGSYTAETLGEAHSLLGELYTAANAVTDMKNKIIKDQRTEINELSISLSLVRSAHADMVKKESERRVELDALGEELDRQCNINAAQGAELKEQQDRVNELSGVIRTKQQEIEKLEARNKNQAEAMVWYSGRTQALEKTVADSVAESKTQQKRAEEAEEDATRLADAIVDSYRRTYPDWWASFVAGKDEPSRTVRVRMPPRYTDD